jgi:hypothetical protein
MIGQSCQLRAMSYELFPIHRLSTAINDASKDKNADYV